MMKSVQIFSFSLVLLCLSGCGSLSNSGFEKKMSEQGTYTCQVKSDALKETPAEADVAKVRCYQDLWQINGNDVSFTRTLYQSKQCETILGRIHYQYSSPNDSSSCELIRSNLSWTAENNGACMLNHLSLNSAHSINPLLKCSEHLPSFCLQSKNTFLFDPKKNSDPNLPAMEIMISDAHHYQSTCKRYLE